jgi:D-arabinose 1-dehydrogenase-like Zn-dependent alcohol dehydrogenase
VERGTIPLVDALHQTHRDGVDVLLDLVSDADAFESHVALVRAGGTAVTTRYVADADSHTGGVRRINFALQPSRENLQRVAGAVVTGQIAAPPITRVSLDEVPAFLSGANAQSIEGKTVVTLPT